MPSDWQASSLTILQDWAAILYTGSAGEDSACILFDGDVDNLANYNFSDGTGVNDRVGSVRVYYAVCPAGCPNYGGGTLSTASVDSNVAVQGVCGGGSGCTDVVAVGAGSGRQQRFIDAFNRNGGKTNLGCTENGAHWWGNEERNKVVIQDFTGTPNRYGDAAIIHDEPREPPDDPNRTVPAYVVHGGIWGAYTNNGGTDWIGPPTSDEFVNSNSDPQSNFRDGYIAWDGNGFRAWPSGNGNWRAEYHNGYQLGAYPTYVRNESRIDHNWGEYAPGGNCGLVNDAGCWGVWHDHFSVRWKKNISLPNGRYRFHTWSDDGVRLDVAGVRIIDEWHSGGSQSHDGEISLTGNTYPVQFDYFEDTGPAYVRLTWERLGDGVWLHEHANFNGRAERFTGNDANLGNNTIGDNTVSSVLIQGDYWAILYEHPDYTGRYQILSGNDGNLGNNPLGHDWASSIKVGRGSPPPDTPPSGSITSPTDRQWINGNHVTIQVNAQDDLSDVKQVNFAAYYLTQAGNADSAGWYSLGSDNNGGDGWGMTWDVSGLPDQFSTGWGLPKIKAQIVDRANKKTDKYRLFGIDRAHPGSSVSSLAPEQNDTSFTVRWSGSDNLSGIKNYDVQYKDGSEGTWTNWKTSTTATSATFNGQAGHTYYFRSRARDKAGNLEPYPGGDGDTHTVVRPLVLVQALSLAPETPVTGEVVTAQFALQNRSEREMTLRRVAIAARGPNCANWDCSNNVDFRPLENITLQPGQTRSFELIQAFTQPGDFFAQIVYERPAGQWHSLGNTLDFSVQPGLQVSQELSLTPSQPVVGEMITAKFNLTNVSNRSITLSRLSAAARGPGCADWSCGKDVSFGLEENVTLLPGQVYTIEERRSFVETGDYFAQVAFEGPPDYWFHIGQQVSFTVGAGLQVVEPLTLSPREPLVGQLVTASYTIKNESSRTLQPRWLGVVSKGPNCSGGDWTCEPDTDFSAEENITLFPGETYVYTAQRTFQNAGGGYFADPAFGNSANLWYFAPGGTRVNFSVSPSLAVISPLTISPANPAVGQAVTASFTVKNVSGEVLNLRRLYAGAVGPDCANWRCVNHVDFPVVENLSLDPDEEYTFSSTRSFQAAGDGYFAQIIYQYTDNDWNHIGVERHFSVGAGLTVVEPLTLSPANPLIGEIVTARYTVKNQSDQTITLRWLGVVSKGPDCAGGDWECEPDTDFPAEQDVTLDPGEEYTYTAQRVFREPGEGFFADPGYGDASGWWYFAPGGERVPFSVTRSLSVVEDLTLSPANPVVGQLVTARFRIKNISGRELTLRRLYAGGKGPDCVAWDCPRIVDFPPVENLTLQPGEEYAFLGARSFQEAGDGYFAQVIYQYTDNDWNHIGVEPHFSVSPGLSVVEPLSLSPSSPLAGEMVTAEYTIENQGDQTIALQALGVISKGPDCAGADWTCIPHVDFPAEYNVTLQPGHRHTYTGERTFQGPGEGFFADPGYGGPSGWWHFVAGGERVEFDVTPSLEVAQPLSLSPADPVVGELVTARYQVKNVSGETLTLGGLAVAARGPNCADWDCGHNADFALDQDVILAPGEVYSFSRQQTFTSVGDGYFAQIIAQYSDGTWYHVGDKLSFGVGPGLEVVEPLALAPTNPLVDQTVTAQFTVHNTSQRSITLRWLGVVSKGPDCMGADWTCKPNTDFPAEENVTVGPGERHTYSQQRTFSENGGGYFADPAFGDASGRWYFLLGGERVDFDVDPSLAVVQSLALSPTDPTVGKLTTARFTVKNVSERVLDLRRLYVGAVGPDCADWYCLKHVDFPVVEDLTLQPGEEYAFASARSFQEAGDSYMAQIIYQYTDSDWNHLGVVRDFSVRKGLTVEEPLTLTPENPLAGEMVTAEYTLKNQGDQTIVLHWLGVVSKGPSCADWECKPDTDFPAEEDISISPGESYTYTAQRVFWEGGEGFFADPGYGDASGWWHFLPGGSRVNFDVTPSLGVVDTLLLAPTNPVVGETVTARYTVQNVSGRVLTLPHVAVAVRGPNCTDWNCGRNADFPPDEDITLQPDETYTFTEQHTFTTAGSGYFAQIVSQLPGGNWYHLDDTVDFAVSSGLTMSSPLTLSPANPSVDEVVAAEYTIENEGSHSITLRWLGVVAKGPDCVDWTCSNWADFPVVENITLDPGDQYTYSEQRSFSEAGEGYFADPAFGDPSGLWYLMPGGKRVEFSVASEACHVDMGNIQTVANLWHQPGGAYDCNGDGTITVEDIMCWVALLGQPCP